MPDEDGYVLIDELPDDDARVKEVFARFGLTAYKAQVFDHGLVNLVAFARGSEIIHRATEIDALFVELFRKTTGALVNTISKENRLGPADLETCRRAVSERNRLIHHFFRDHAEDFISAAGQQIMINDLAEIALLLDAAETACSRVTLEVGKARGLTAELVNQEFNRLMERAAD